MDTATNSPAQTATLKSESIANRLITELERLNMRIADAIVDIEGINSRMFGYPVGEVTSTDRPDQPAAPGLSGEIQTYLEKVDDNLNRLSDQIQTAKGIA